MAETRDILKQPDWDEVEVGQRLVLDDRAIRQFLASGAQGDIPMAADLLGSVLGRGRHKISQTVSRIKSVIQRAVSDGCAEGTLVLQAIIRGIRDICFMYSSVFPVMFRKELEVPQLAMQSANDFFYLSDEISILKHTIPGFRAAAEDTDFTEEAKLLRIAGRKILENQVRFCPSK